MAPASAVICEAAVMGCPATSMRKVCGGWSVLTRADPEVQRCMVRVAARARSGAAIPTVPLDTVEALIRERLAQ
jgi:hypothetical protein